MASRYWVGGTDNWDATAGTKWALTTGAAGGQAVPTASDDVFFDANSGAVTVTTSVGGRTCNSLDFTGFTGTFNAVSTLTVSNNLILGASMTFGGSGTVTLNSSGASTITSNAVAFKANLTLNGTGSWTFQDNFTTAPAGANTGRITLTKGTLDGNGHNITCAGLISTGALTRSLTLGSGTWTLVTNGNTIVQYLLISGSGFTYSNTNSTIVLNPIRFSPIINVDSTLFRFNNLTVTGPMSGQLGFGTGSALSVFVDGTFTLNPQVFIVGAGKFITDHLVAKGDPVNGYITIGDPNLATVTFQTDTTLYDCDYLILYGSTAQNSSSAPINAYAGSHSVDGGSNTGWIFDDATHLADNSNTVSTPLIPELVLVNP